MHGEATQFALATTNHNAFSFVEMKSVDTGQMRVGEINDMNASLKNSHTA